MFITGHFVVATDFILIIQVRQVITQVLLILYYYFILLCLISEQFHLSWENTTI